MTGSSIELRLAYDLSTVSAIVEKTISTIYPHYYPAGAVQFFLDLHSIARMPWVTYTHISHQNEETLRKISFAMGFIAMTTYRNC